MEFKFGDFITATEDSLYGQVELAIVLSSYKSWVTCIVLRTKEKTDMQFRIYHFIATDNFIKYNLTDFDFENEYIKYLFIFKKYSCDFEEFECIDVSHNYNKSFFYLLEKFYYIAPLTMDYIALISEKLSSSNFDWFSDVLYDMGISNVKIYCI